MADGFGLQSSDDLFPTKNEKGDVTEKYDKNDKNNEKVDKADQPRNSIKTGGSTISSLTQSNMTGANTKTIAESDLEVLMMNFSAFEVKAIAYEGVWNVDILKYKIIAALVIAIVALALLTYSAAVQIISGLETYILLYITLMLLVSLYILYDFLRLLAVFKLANLHDDQIVFLAETVAQENARFNIVLKESFHDLGIQDKGAKRISSIISKQRKTEDGDDGDANHKPVVRLAQGVDENKIILPGYWRIFISLAVMIALGVLGFTEFIVTPRNPSGHHPTFSPTR
jgi:hypothetical protein